MTDGRWASSEPQLVERIRDEIMASPDGRITFARFMERALTEPRLGYYATSAARPTREGDFLTAPELHPFFGRCLGRWLMGAWERLGRPAPFTVEEHGAGRGTLRDRTLDGLADEAPRLAEVISWRAIDLDMGVGEPTGDGLVGVVLANELLDALPVHRVVGTADGLRELHVVWREGWFAFEAGPLASATLAERLAGIEAAAAPGHVADVSLAAPAWLELVASRLVRGYVLVIDYGHPAAELYGSRRPAGTLLAYRDHEVRDEVLDAVGRQDLTAHVDVTALERAAEAAGLRSEGATTQARFLAALGLGEMLADLGRQPGVPAATYLEARASVARLIDPRHLGSFRALAWSRGVTDVRPLPGFAPGD